MMDPENLKAMHRWHHSGAHELKEYWVQVCPYCKAGEPENRNHIRDDSDRTFREWVAAEFEYEFCDECGGDVLEHDPLLVAGRWAARCRNGLWAVGG